ncbi:hypothetical protein A2V56_03760 [Candidatus Woesebacteria bacterium RBG_19FT_COMBO_42_9]|uniref:Uncharacterized protein n=1 Tax=Candidatus Woesebacteria bacterium RBG_16_42_24 TaxID=1802485 RepID=A0A1F7XKH3_9BACT|nr:MAG: hypothetical protein A2V97_00480 [Candidatus Woesebacteria bacterium RBG_16_42_24]OGM17582.1 MAG: hypothetical protein A2V56_03760 [Candidatus Woesebacteria bacterium RBG_19FT_COMBO_42_9]OGM67089.1 MAG: hypothetical protein A2985_02445 [Candidatus Woesebacteria bacterium RIFCSPLOWO2_01_FULL_43_11]
MRLITTLHKSAKDPVTGKINNVIRAVYAYEYHQDPDNLKVEGKQAQRFEVWKIEDLLRGLNDTDKKRFIASMLEKDYLEIYKKIEELIPR